MKVYKGTTPTVVLAFDNANLDQAESVYVTFSKSKDEELFTLTGDRLTVTRKQIRIPLTQTETLNFPDRVLCKANWTFRDSEGNLKRACSDDKMLAFEKNLLGREI